jgi:hypothetical protein
MSEEQQIGVYAVFGVSTFALATYPDQYIDKWNVFVGSSLITLGYAVYANRCKLIRGVYDLYNYIIPPDPRDDKAARDLRYGRV